MSQESFAKYLDVSVCTLRAWEQGFRVPGLKNQVVLMGKLKRELKNEI
jgi:DNA-binding transcriptional regulator YiaG